MLFFLCEHECENHMTFKESTHCQMHPVKAIAATAHAVFKYVWPSELQKYSLVVLIYQIMVFVFLTLFFLNTTKL